MPRSPDIPLLTLNDIRQPLKFDELTDARETLAIAGIEPSVLAQTAIAFYRRSQIEEVIDDPTASLGQVREKVEEYYDVLPDKIRETDLLSRLVADLTKARAEAAQITRPLNEDLAIDDLTNKNHAFARSQSERLNARRQKIVSRIGKRVVKAVGHGAIPTRVKGGKLGLKDTLHDPDIYLEVGRYLETQGLNSKVYRVMVRGKGIAAFAEDIPVADVMVLSSTKSAIYSGRNLDLHNPFDDPQGFESRQIYAQHSSMYSKYKVAQVHPPVFWMS